MKARKIEGRVDKAEGRCCGFPYDTQLVSSAGVSIHFWVGLVGPEYASEAVNNALAVARRHRDIVSVTWSPGQPTGFWANQDMT